jgi:hypothetical protein
LASIRPDLLTEWSPANQKAAAEVSAFSNECVEWICGEGHVYRMRVSKRTRLRRCPLCHENLLATPRRRGTVAELHPHLAAQWHPDNPRPVDQVPPGSRMKARWVCASGHEWETQVSTRTRRDAGCPECRRRSLHRTYVTDANRFSLKRPESLLEWDPSNPVSPDDVAEFSFLIVKWICPRGHRYEQRVASRSEGKGCPFCCNQKVLPENSFGNRMPDLVREWHPCNELSPYEVAPTSCKRVTWICSRGHLWEAEIVRRTKGHGCRRCYFEARRRGALDPCGGAPVSVKAAPARPARLLPYGEEPPSTRPGAAGKERR